MTTYTEEEVTWIAKRVQLYYYLLANPGDVGTVGLGGELHTAPSESAKAFVFSFSLEIAPSLSAHDRKTAHRLQHTDGEDCEECYAE